MRTTTGTGRFDKGDYVDGLVMAVDGKAATVKIGPYRAVLTPPDFAWTGAQRRERNAEARRRRRSS